MTHYSLTSLATMSCDALLTVELDHNVIWRTTYCRDWPRHMTHYLLSSLATTSYDTLLTVELGHNAIWHTTYCRTWPQRDMTHYLLSSLPTTSYNALLTVELGHNVVYDALLCVWVLDRRIVVGREVALRGGIYQCYTGVIYRTDMFITDAVEPP